jgi:hypothetical protein
MLATTNLTFTELPGLILLGSLAALVLRATIRDQYSVRSPVAENYKTRTLRLKRRRGWIKGELERVTVGGQCKRVNFG